MARRPSMDVYKYEKCMGSVLDREVLRRDAAAYDCLRDRFGNEALLQDEAERRLQGILPCNEREVQYIPEPITPRRSSMEVPGSRSRMRFSLDVSSANDAVPSAPRAGLEAPRPRRPSTAVYTSSIEACVTDGDIISAEVAATVQLSQRSSRPRRSSIDFSSVQFSIDAASSASKFEPGICSPHGGLSPSALSPQNTGQSRNVTLGSGGAPVNLPHAGLSRVNLLAGRNSSPLQPTALTSGAATRPTSPLSLEQQELNQLRRHSVSDGSSGTLGSRGRESLGAMAAKFAYQSNPAAAAKAAAAKLCGGAASTGRPMTAAGGDRARPGTAAQMVRTNRRASMTLTMTEMEQFSQGDVMSRLARWGDGNRLACNS